MSLRSWIACVALWVGMVSGLAQGKAQARLLFDAATVPPGSAFYGAVELTPPPGWHTYWRNPGDSGQRTKIEWKLPEGITAGDIHWPPPRTLTEAGITSFVYDGRVVLPVRFTVVPNHPVGPVAVSAKVTWLECDKECVPGRAMVTNTFTVGSPLVASPDQKLITDTLARVPVPAPEGTVSAAWENAGAGDDRNLLLRVPPVPKRILSGFIPYENAGADLGPQPELLKPLAGVSLIRVKVTRTGTEWPRTVAGLLVYGGTEMVEFSVPIGSILPVPKEPEVPAGTTAEAPVTRSLLAMMGLAFLGGLILNIMPCVLPVIALKILGFVKQSGQEPRRIRVLGFVYTLGVLASFAVLALLVILIQGAGHTASWGMQFQNPVFLVGITTLVTLVALNLFGVFEVTLSSGAVGAASELASRGGKGGAFFNGVFTTVLATPCSAPFLGAALGFAFGQPPAILMLLFLTAGLGLALPYLLLSVQPGWLKYLPKPGNWMITFKMIMGFPMLATVLWLLSLAPDHFGQDGVFWLGMFLLCVALAAWLYGRQIQMGQGNRIVAWVGIIAAVAGGFGFVLKGQLKLDEQLNWRSPTPATVAAASANKNRTSINWEPWSPAAVDRAVADGKPVLVDFTAKWCLTCKVNKALAIEVPTVRERMKALGFVALRGDYTREDPAIAMELKRWKRAGVPLVLVYSRNPDVPPRVLPEQLTPGLVMDALEWAGK
ncbi:MAG: protein-disulfide reductase DsbD family protein [Verrucomicrobiota bacterium]